LYYYTYQNQNNSWKPYCVVSFCMGWQDVAHNVCCHIRADDNSSTCAFTMGKSALLMEHPLQ
jgi:hypothetical protein